LPVGVAAATPTIQPPVSNRGVQIDKKQFIYHLLFFTGQGIIEITAGVK